MTIKRYGQYHNGHSMSVVQFGLQLGASPAKRIDVAVVGTQVRLGGRAYSRQWLQGFSSRSPLVCCDAQSCTTGQETVREICGTTFGVNEITFACVAVV